MPRGPDRVFDEYLVASSQAGSRAAFDALARRWTPRLLRYAARTLGPARASAASILQLPSANCRRSNATS